MQTLAFFQNMGMGEWLIILVIVLLLFGSAKLPTLARSLGSSVNEFKKGMKEGTEGTPPNAAPPAQTPNATNAPAVPTDKK